MIRMLYAAEAGAAPAAPQGGFVNFVPLLVIFGIFYLLLIRPQQKKAKEHQQLLNDLKRGDRILTTGGIYGVITGLRGKVLEIKISEEVKIQISRSAVAGLASLDADGAVSENITEAEVVKK